MNKLLCHCQIIDFALGLGFAYDATAAEYERPTRCFAPSLILDKKIRIFQKDKKYNVTCQTTTSYVIPCIFTKYTFLGIPFCKGLLSA